MSNVQSYSPLFHALLAMDPYNRGYNAGVKSLGADPREGITSGQLGSVMLGLRANSLGAESASFFAQAYRLSDGTTVISYRGTDEALQDADTGYGIGAGGVLSSPFGNTVQGRLALEFYNSVIAQEGVDPSKIVLTGHSLGGGLAGLVAALHRKPAVIFDHMPFEDSANNIFASINDPANASYKALIYGSGPVEAPTFTQIQSHYIPGGQAWNDANMVGDLRPVSSITSTPYTMPYGVDLSVTWNNRFGERHDPALMVIRMFLDGPLPSTAWQNSARYVIPHLFDDRIAEGAGFLRDEATGVWNPAGKLMGALAYSVLENGERPYGDAAIRAFQNDMNDLTAAGAILDPIVSAAANGIGMMVVLEAGRLANSRAFVTSAGSQGALDHQGGLLVAHANIALPEFIVATLVGDLTTALRSGAFASKYEIGSMSLGMAGQDLRHVEIATSVYDTQIDSTELAASLLVGNDGDDRINAGDGDSLILAGAGRDTVIAGAGIDRVYLGSGDDDVDIAFGASAAEADQVFGGSGSDTIILRQSDPDVTRGFTVDFKAGTANDGVATIVMIDVENAVGGAGADRFIGGAQANHFNGGSGVDTVDYSASAAGVSVLLTPGVGADANPAQESDARFDSYESIENVIGTAFNDRIEGDGADNRLEGGAGVDRIRGGGGNDHLIGGESGPLIGSEHLDVAIYSGRWIDYEVNRTVPGSEQFTVTDRRGGTPEGADLVDQFEFFVFEGDGPGTAVRATFVENVAPVRIDLVNGGSLIEGSYGAGYTIASFQWEDRNAYDQVRSWSASGFASGTINAIDDLFQVAWDAGTGLMSLQFARDVTLDFESWSSRVANWAQWANGAFAGSVPALALAGTAYGATLTVTDWGGLSLSRSFAFQITDVDETPIFFLPPDHGDGDDGLATFHVAENTLDVGSILAASPVPGQAVAFTLEGADTARFEIDATGRIRFKTAPDFEQAADAGLHNAYDLVVRATAAQTSATQAVRIIVDNVNEAPAFPNQDSLAVALPENSVASIAIPQAIDPDAGDVLRYAISGDDAARFDVDPVTGAIRPRAPLDFENRQDADGDGIYRLTLTATDQGGLIATRDVAVTVTDVNESPFAIRWTSGGSVPEHSRPGVLVGQVIASDPEGGPIAFSLASPDERFTITPDGRIFTASTNPLALDFETAASATVAIRATDAGGLSTVMTLAVSVTNVAETRWIGTTWQDSRTGGAGIDIMEGRAGHDTLTGGAGDDILMGEEGVDSLTGGDGHDWLLGGADHDRLTGGSGDDLLVGGTGSDTLDGGQGNDVLDGGDGDDTFIPGHGADRLLGGSGYDTVDMSTATASMRIDFQFGGILTADGDDILVDIERVNAGSGDDVIIGSSRAEDVSGAAGTNYYYGSLGADRFWDAGISTLDYSGSPTGIRLVAAEPWNNTMLGTGGFAEGDQFFSTGHMTIIGTAFDDVVTGRRHNPAVTSFPNSGVSYGHENIITGAGNDVIQAQSGSHVIDAGSGDDTISTSGIWDDTIIGGSGFDVIDPGWGNDVIDFGAGGGRLRLVGSPSAQNRGEVPILASVDVEAGIIEQREYSGQLMFAAPILYQSILTGEVTEFEMSSHRVLGSFRNERFIGSTTTGIQHFDGRGGDDVIDGRGTLIGGDGNDTITFFGGSFADGGSGNDVLTSRYDGASSQRTLTMSGGSGDDTMRGNSWTILEGGSGADMLDGWSYGRVTYVNSSQGIRLVNGVGTGGDAQGDTVVRVAHITGSQFSDHIEHQEYWNGGEMLGLGGDDTIISSASIVRGGIGNDFIRGGQVMHGDEGNDTIVAGSGTAYGGVGDDTLIGASTWGSNWSPTLIGGEGNDVFMAVEAGTRHAVMDGGNDTLIWKRGVYSTARISQFTPGEDKIVIDRALASDPTPTLRFTALNTQDTQVEVLFMRPDQTPAQLDHHHKGILTFHGMTPTMLSESDFFFM